MRAALVAASLLSLVAAQRLTTTDDTGETIVISVTTNLLGVETTSTLSTITDPAIATSSTSTTSSAARPLITTSSARSTTSSAANLVEETISTSSTSSAAPTKTKPHGIVGAPDTATGDTDTVYTYWYPPAGDPSGEWLVGTWTNSFVPPTEPSGAVPAGQVAATYRAKNQDQAAATAGETGQSTNNNGAASLFERGGLAAGVAVAIGAGAGAMLGFGF